MKIRVNNNDDVHDNTITAKSLYTLFIHGSLIP